MPGRLFPVSLSVAVMAIPSPAVLQRSSEKIVADASGSSAVSSSRLTRSSRSPDATSRTRMPSASGNATFEPSGETLIL